MKTKAFILHKLKSVRSNGRFAIKKNCKNDGFALYIVAESFLKSQFSKIVISRICRKKTLKDFKIGIFFFENPQNHMRVKILNTTLKEMILHHCDISKKFILLNSAIGFSKKSEII